MHNEYSSIENQADPQQCISSNVAGLLYGPADTDCSVELAGPKSHAAHVLTDCVVATRAAGMRNGYRRSTVRLKLIGQNRPIFRPSLDL